MKKLTQEEFDARLQDRVNLIGKSFAKLVEQIEQRPDLMDEPRFKKTFGFLNGLAAASQEKAEIARRLQIASTKPFSLDDEPVDFVTPAPKLLPYPPGVRTPVPGVTRSGVDPELGGRIVGQGSIHHADDDGVDFIDED